jgi:predicted secreted protein
VEQTQLLQLETLEVQQLMQLYQQHNLHLTLTVSWRISNRYSSTVYKCAKLVQSANTGQTTGSGGGHSHNMSANFTGDATSVVQPYLTVFYIIKT